MTWSQVSSLLPPGTSLHFYHALGSVFPLSSFFLLLVDWHRISPIHALLAISTCRFARVSCEIRTHDLEPNSYAAYYWTTGDAGLSCTGLPSYSDRYSTQRKNNRTLHIFLYGRRAKIEIIKIIIFLTIWPES